MDRLTDFLETEIMDGLYQEMVMFIEHCEIRNGEFEGNRYVVKKLNHDDFIVFLEDVYPDGRKEVSDEMPMHREQILGLINAYAYKIGLTK